jgi:hypothetical protein
MSVLPTYLDGFAPFLEVQPRPIQDIFTYCLCLTLVQAGKMDLVGTVPGDDSPLCVFRTPSEDSIVVRRPKLDPAHRRQLMNGFWEILYEEELLDQSG